MEAEAKGFLLKFKKASSMDILNSSKNILFISLKLSSGTLS